KIAAPMASPRAVSPTWAMAAPRSTCKRYAGQSVIGDGDPVPHRLPGALSGGEDPRPQPWGQPALRGRAHGPPLSARHAHGRAALGTLSPLEDVRGLQLL